MFTTTEIDINHLQKNFCLNVVFLNYYVNGGYCKHICLIFDL